jgi:hypothetical protein
MLPTCIYCHDLILLSAQFGYIIVYVWNLKGYLHIKNRGVPWQFASGAEGLVLKALKFHYMCICRKLLGRTGVSHYRSIESFMESQFTITA